MPKEFKKPKRKPDAVLVLYDHPDVDGTIYTEEFYFWFEELVATSNHFYKTVKNRKKDRYTTTFSIDRISSMRGFFSWIDLGQTGYVISSNDDDAFSSLDPIRNNMSHIDDIYISKRVEKLYQNWLATKALEEVLATPKEKK
jgi:hypothetical protein